MLVFLVNDLYYKQKGDLKMADEKLFTRLAKERSGKNREKLEVFYEFQRATSSIQQKFLSDLDEKLGGNLQSHQEIRDLLDRFFRDLFEEVYGHAKI